ncbi:MAG: protein kinase [Planctomycetota bacterium]|nr:protein kinase [Planctomycetota bacterium]
MNLPAGQTIEQQLQQACAELERLLGAGEPCSAKQLLESRGDLAANKEVSLELIYTEFVVRSELGEHPLPERWLQDFPLWRTDLKELFQVHELIAEDERDTSVGAAATTDGLAGVPAQMQPGACVGQYELLEEIGRGGMGVVYKARQRGLNRLVAVKMILSAHASRIDRARFRLEAEAASQLQHPNIVQIHEVGSHDGTPYMAMELVEGPNLHQQLAEHPLSPQAAATLVKTLALAIDFAHQHDIIHRDLKPGNILLTADSTPKITDFGLAKRIHSEDGTGIADSALTRTGALLGTPSYMAPEQADERQGRIGPATDIYTLGVILYEAMTGRLPFHADTPIATLEQVCNQEPVPPRRLVSTVPRDLETICLKCLEKEAHRRYASAWLLAEDLQRHLAGEPIVARRAGPIERTRRWCRRKPGTAGLIAMLALAIVAGSTGIIAQWQRAERNAVVARHERDLSEANYQKARDVVDRLTALSNALINQPGVESIRRRTLEEALTLYESLLDQRSDDPVLRFETALAALRAGTIQHELGRYADAEQTLRRGVEILDDLIDKMPDNFGHQDERARCYLRLGHVFKDRFESSDALKCYADASNQWHDILSADPRADYARRGIANALLNAYAILITQDDVTGAEQTCYECIEWELWQPDEPFPDVVSASNGAHEFSDLLRRVRSFVVGNAISGKRQMGDLAIGLDALCRLLLRQHRFAEAEETCRFGIALRQQAAEDDPESSEEMHYLARAHKNLGDILNAVDRDSLAADSYLSAIALWKPIVADYASRPSYRTELKDADQALAKLLLSDGRRHDAEKLLRQVCELDDSLLRDFPQELQYYRDLGSSLKELGELHFHLLEQYDVGITEYKRALDVYEQLLERFPEEHRERVSIGTLHQGIAVFHAEMGRQGEAEASFGAALKVLQDLVDEFPENTYYRERLAASHVVVGHHFATWKQFAVAIEHYEAAVRYNPQLGRAYNGLAWLLVTCPDRQQQDAGRAVDLARQAVALNRNEAAYWNTLGAALYRANKWEDAVPALSAAVAVRNRGLGEDWYFLAMAQWQMGNKQLAQECYSQASHQAQQQDAMEAASASIRAEAEALLGRPPTAPVFSEECLQSTALAGFDYLLAEQPDVWWLYDHRAYAHAARNHWQACADDFAKAYELNSTFHALLVVQAGALLMAGNRDEYQDVCADASERLSNEPEHATRYVPAKICLLAPNPTLQPDKVIAFAQQAVDSQPTSGTYRHLLALAFYRAGDYEQTVQAVLQGLESAPTWSGHVTNWFLLSLAHHQLGNVAESMEWKLKAESWLAANHRPFCYREFLLHPHDWLQCMLLQRELADR